jgi:hypothetical protein
VVPSPQKCRIGFSFPLVPTEQRRGRRK